MILTTRLFIKIKLFPFLLFVNVASSFRGLAPLWTRRRGPIGDRFTAKIRNQQKYPLQPVAVAPSYSFNTNGEDQISTNTNNNNNNNNNKKDNGRDDSSFLLLLLSSLKQDLEALSELRPAKPSADESIPPAIVSAGSSYTRIWTHHTWSIHSDPPHKRYFRHILKWGKSSTAKKIMPAVLFAGLWGTIVSILAKYCYTYLSVSSATHHHQFMSLPVQMLQTAAESTSPTFAFLSAPLALLLTLRANASMARLLEARQAWGRLVLHSRTLSSILKTYVLADSPVLTVLAVRYLAMSGWILKAQLRGEDDKATQRVMRLMLPEPKYDAEYPWLSTQPKKSVALASRIRQICAVALSNSDSKNQVVNNGATQLIIEEQIRDLEQVVGICERLFGSPIPPTYTRHLSRVMSLWILLLPISLSIGGALSTVGVACASTVAAYVFIGLDEVGMEIEDVFQLMPLQQLAAATQNDVANQFLAEIPELSVY